jgi:signal transduction histidine kinase
MFGKKIGLRLHIFAAFCLVFVISFSTVFIAFRLVIQNYIDSDSREKIKTTSENTLELAKELRFQSLFKPQTEKRSSIRGLIRLVSGNSDVGIAILDSNLYIDFPKTTDSYSDRVQVASILKALKKQEINLNARNENILFIESSCYYTLLVPFNRDFFTEDANAPDSFFLFYLDSTPYRKFADSLDRTLYVVLITALLLSLVTSLLVSNSIIQSLHKLTSFASRIGAGDFRELNGHFMDKELDSLAGDMNLMAHRLSKADTEQKTFFQNASHELRTPLMSIQGYAEGIKYKVFDNPDEATEVIISESKRLSDMVENLLTLSRLDLNDSGVQLANKSSLDLRELADSVIENIRGSVLLAKKNLSQSYPERPVTVFGNENDLFRALENILSNAIRHASSEIDLEIKSANRSAVITITDDGEGIPDELLSVIFNRFVRGEKGKHGIGLALVKAIVENHGGSVSAANRSDGRKGAVFTLMLPLQTQ